MLPLAREIIFFREKWGMTANVCVYDGCGFRSRVLSPWVNEIKKTKLHTNTSPHSWHKHFVVCSIASTVNFFKTCLKSTATFCWRVRVHVNEFWFRSRVKVHVNVCFKSSKLSAERKLVQRHRVVRVTLLKFSSSPIFLNFLCQTAKKICAVARYLFLHQAETLSTLTSKSRQVKAVHVLRVNETLSSGACATTWVHVP